MYKVDIKVRGQWRRIRGFNKRPKRFATYSDAEEAITKLEAKVKCKVESKIFCEAQIALG